ncbi:MAG: GTP cyclohydrolase I FolE2 [Bdellovibrionaceae bacterium]|nr:GTP cyclohydrolase I FolE2 [Pseudobdellovibrionaceae bacterium]MBX3033309.1 GTP cyclohydrolase I FolE2 [Pseudobdellovibrionaceae bacterium]
MDTLEPQPRRLPDVAHETDRDFYAPLEWVGMSDIEVPVILEAEDGAYRQAARADAHVSLDKSPSRGIHMSRLYLLVQQGLARRALGAELLRDLVREFLKSHESLSRSARLRVRFDWPLERPALKSANKAWRTYPARLDFESVNGEEKFFLETTVTYSSTCPASAALSRQLIQENFRARYAGRADELSFEDLHQWLGTTDGVVATPHAQRSLARVRVRLAPESPFRLRDLIDRVEDALQTAVQGAVKREDEQEFALRNGQNLMFCEDAARRVKKALDAEPAILGYEASFNHVESLHPHSAISFIRR